MDYGPYVTYMVVSGTELPGYPVAGYQARSDTGYLTMKPTNISDNQQLNRIPTKKMGISSWIPDTEKCQISSATLISTYLILSLCALYSMAVPGGRFKTRRNVSRIRFVTAVSFAVRFHIEIMSSWNLNSKI